MKILGLEEKQKNAVNITLKHLNFKHEIELQFKASDCLRVYSKGKCIVIEYSEICEIYRGLSFVERVIKKGIKIEQNSRVSRRGILADCSRNGVLNVESVNELIITAATMGYNNIGLYVEDIYPIDEYEYFGHKRGAYSKDEIKSFIEFANIFGIEITFHIQTLGHLQVIKDWPCFASLFDIDGVLLADDEAVYEFIENEIKAVREFLTCDYLYIGMDEAYTMGRGKYLDKHGYVDKMKLFLRHLNRVCKICEKYNFKPIVPTDMFFNFQTGGYWSKDTKLTKEIVEMMPKNLVLEYWDYYFQPKDADMIENMCVTHIKSGHETWYVCGAWNWHGITPKNYYSNFVTPTQCEIAIKHGIDSIIVATFGDDGAECPIFAVFPAILRTAEQFYGSNNEEEINIRSIECLGIEYNEFLKIDIIGILGEEYDFDANCPSTLEKGVFYNDIMLGLMNANINKFNIDGKYNRDAKTLKSVPESRYNYLFETQIKLAEFLDIYALLPIKIKKYYAENDKKQLKKICDKTIPSAIKALEDFEIAYNKQWHKVYKPFGFDVQQLRIGGMMLRIKDSRKRIYEYLNGDIDKLEELESKDLPFDDPSCGLRGSNFWHRIVSKSVF